MTRMMSRRAALTAMGLGLATTACGTAETSAPRPAPQESAPSGTARGSAPSCVLAPEGTEGPYYLDTSLVRGNIAEGKPGVPLDLRITVVDATSCRPLASAAVDIWHADALGVYSGVSGDGNSRFLRGIQPTDASGVAAFTTIFPGWYDNRTSHIHLKVHVEGNEIHTNQLYFAEEVTTAVAAVTPYAERTDPRTSNSSDFLFRRGGGETLLTMTGTPGNGYLAEITVGIRV